MREKPFLNNGTARNISLLGELSGQSKKLSSSSGIDVHVIGVCGSSKCL